MAIGRLGNSWRILDRGVIWGRGILKLGAVLGALCVTQTAAAQADDILYEEKTEETSTSDESSTDEFSEQADETDSETQQPEPEMNELGLTEDELGGECLPSCEPGTRCRDGKCISLCDPACGLGEVCTGEGICTRLGGVHARMDEGAEQRERERRDESLVGIRGFGGLVLGGGMSVYAEKLPGRDKLDDPLPSGAVYFALKGGVMLEVVEFSVEWAPSTYIPAVGGDDAIIDSGDWIGSLLGNFGFHIPLTERVYWPLRVGAGVIPAGGRYDFQGRIDLVSLSIKTRYLLLEAALPSVRYTSDFDDWHRWTGLVLLGVSYVSP